ncbi:hypothetical protein AB0B31_01780 [Catellatospora citrea]|uniref:hypothetical protein n=1 Tax=Catellatospora citrea TaxID=53366 RepID=UPI0033DCC233
MFTAHQDGKRGTGTAPAARRTAAPEGVARHAIFNRAWSVNCCASAHIGTGCRPMSLMPN